MVPVVLFVLGLVHGLVAVGVVCAFLGRRVQRPGGVLGRRRGPVRIALGLVGLGLAALLLAVELGWFYANSKWDEVERVDVDRDGRSALAGGDAAGTNYLLVGTDSRPGFPQNLADTILVLRVGDGPPRMVSLPRDLFVTIPDRGEQGRINSSYSGGPTSLIRTVQESVGIPIDRYVEINFVAFAGVIDAVGGVTITFPHPAIDTKSGLNVEQSGDVRLDGTQALAYVRSRAYQEVIDGQVQPPDGLADLSRVQRQQTFLRAVLSEAGGSRNPFELARIGDALTEGLKVDNHMELVDALGLLWAVSRGAPQPTELPVDFVEGETYVVLGADAPAVIADFAG